MPLFSSAPDIQALLRKLYHAETGRAYTEGGLTLKQKHDIQNLYAFKRGKTTYMATRKDARPKGKL